MSYLCILITTHARGSKKQLLVVIDSFFDQDTVLGGYPLLLRSGKKISNFELIPFGWSLWNKPINDHEQTEK